MSKWWKSLIVSAVAAGAQAGVDQITGVGHITGHTAIAAGVALLGTFIVHLMQSPLTK